jgi:ABC-type bacteriocin/lantibiotic exporter with double-glycine peptidase domain
MPNENRCWSSTTYSIFGPLPAKELRLGVPCGMVDRRAALAASFKPIIAMYLDPLSRINDAPRSCSGGMRQQLQLARDLVSRLRQVLMDEQAGGLDVSIEGSMTRSIPRPCQRPWFIGVHRYPRSRNRTNIIATDGDAPRTRHQARIDGSSAR